MNGAAAQDGLHVLLSLSPSPSCSSATATSASRPFYRLSFLDGERAPRTKEGAREPANLSFFQQQFFLQTLFLLRSQACDANPAMPLQPCVKLNSGNNEGLRSAETNSCMSIGVAKEGEQARSARAK
jgi:hypothetical protein